MRQCLWCTEEFSPRVARQVYCKRRCKELAEQSRVRGGSGERTREHSKVNLKGLTVAERRAYNKAGNRRRALQENGWTPESFAAAKHVQSNRCAICGETPSKPHGQSDEQLVPDHKHGKSPMARGLLCSWCNSLIGFAKDSPERCEAAAAYLRKFSQPTGAVDDSRIEHCRENG
jgi:hypothetical protein